MRVHVAHAGVAVAAAVVVVDFAVAVVAVPQRYLLHSVLMSAPPLRLLLHRHLAVLRRYWLLLLPPLPPLQLRLLSQWWDVTEPPPMWAYSVAPPHPAPPNSAPSHSRAAVRQLHRYAPLWAGPAFETFAGKAVHNTAGSTIHS